MRTRKASSGVTPKIPWMIVELCPLKGASTLANRGSMPESEAR